MKHGSEEMEGSPPRIYDVTWPADTPYRPHTRKTGYHYGQRKLLMAEIEFMTLYGDRSDTVLYVGAAPGLHLRVLVDLFPLHRFFLYDPCPFHPRLQDPQWAGQPRITLHETLFTDERAALHAVDHKGCLFISDVRHKEVQDQFPSEACVMEDMSSQRRWAEILDPSAMMLKFRLPWCHADRPEPSPMEYFAGELRLPVWGCPSTTETRLIATHPYHLCVWNCSLYERHMFYFNTTLRARSYGGMSYDEAAEHDILRSYIQHCAPRQKMSLLRQRILRELVSHSCAP